MKTSLTVLLIMQLYGLTSCVIKHHYYINLEKTWDAARQYCRYFYYDLSTFTNETEEQHFLQDAVYQTSIGWIGLYKESGIWMWAGGEVATQISWDAAQPETGDCTYLHYTSKKVNNKRCISKYTFFCMTVYEFVVVQQIETWETALEYCRDHYNDLATLSSNRNMEYALRKMTEAQTEYVWIGLRFLAGEWFWLNGDDLKYKAWSEAGQPQCPARNLRCGALDKKTKIWTPRDCEDQLSFLCFFVP